MSIRKKGISAIEVHSFEDPRLVPVGSWLEDKNKVMRMNDQNGIFAT